MNKHLLLISLGLIQAISILPAQATGVASDSIQVKRTQGQSISQSLLDQGQQLYEQGRYSKAAALLNQALETAAQQGNVPDQVVSLRNLALIELQQGNLDLAQELIRHSLGLVNRLPQPQHAAFLAPLLDVEGGIQNQMGQSMQAYATWDRAYSLYSQLGNKTKANDTRINQAYALQQLGFNRRAIALLTPVVEQLNSGPDSISKASSLRSLGDAFYATGNLEEAQQLLTASLAVAKRLHATDVISQVQLSLGNLNRAQGQGAAALDLYLQAAAETTSPLIRVQAQINQLSTLIEAGQLTEAQALLPGVLASLDSAPPSRDFIYARINLAKTLIQSSSQLGVSPSSIYAMLASAVKQSQTLQDARSESFALGTLGSLYEKENQLGDALRLTEKALELAQSTNSSDILYRWQWQLGRIYKAQARVASDPENIQRAISAYSGAVKTLKALRTDLVAINPQAQASFQDSVEPIHRELVSILLDSKTREVTQQDLDQARNTIEALQLAELDNFLREACLEAAQVNIDSVDARAAVIYPILLNDRLEVIVSLPKQQLRHYSLPVSRQEVEQLATRLRQSLVIRVGNQFMPDAQQLYNLIIRPIENDLAAANTTTLVFVLDGVLRNLPMASLHDGKQFLIEKYSLAVTPGLQLLNPKPLQRRKLSVLTAALSESRQGFSSLPNTATEVKEIQTTVPGDLLLNQKFTDAEFKDQLNSKTFPIVHLATHGKFSSQKEDTYVLTWDGRLNIDNLASLLKSQELKPNGVIELLVLSACETGTGDRLAALGMAGLAVRAGARSTVASLWQINDEATALLMERFYKELAGQKSTKAEALRQAQLEVLKDPRFREHPYFWAPYILVGNWL
jgi:CHAT domain-containing protein/predicted negative regulator of RcsB-dependent stress response